jgi:hypothetical protein
MKALDKLLFAGVASATLSVSFIAPSVAAVGVPGYVEIGEAWTHTASSCAVNPQDLDKAAFSGPDFTFQPQAYSGYFEITQFGPLWEPITANCNVLNPLDADPAAENPLWDALIVGYADPDGVGTNTNVVARLIRVRRNDGIQSTVVTFDSNKFNTRTPGEQLLQFSPPMDFKNNEYFVQLALLRTPLAGHSNPVVYSVRLVRVEQITR